MPKKLTRQPAGLKILVIDDQKTIRRTAETLLNKEGCEVVTAIDGFEALAKIADHQPRDHLRRHHDAAARRLSDLRADQAQPDVRATPVIMLSSKDGLFDRARGRIVGSEQYLTKPFTKEELLGAIRRHVSH